MGRLRARSVFLLLASAWCAFADDWTEALRLQVALDRLGFSPGVLDGKVGRKTKLAMELLARSRGAEAPLSPADIIPAGLQATRRYAITRGDVELVGHVPKDWERRSELDVMTYETLHELVAERGHCTRATVERLNPGVDMAKLRVGDWVVLPNVLDDPGPEEPVDTIVVDLEAKTVTAYDRGDRVVALFHCSIAAFAEKRPAGTTSVKVVATDPEYTFDPAKWPEVKGVDRKLRIPPGPRNPVGLAWIGLELPGYGIHGTPAPEMIGKSGSHGCIRLTNWDAVRLAKRVLEGTPVRFLNGAAR